MSNMGIQAPKIGPHLNQPALKKPGTPQGEGPSFDQTLKDQLGSVTKVKAHDGPLKLKFSNHAVERMRQRGLHFTPETLSKIDSAITKAGEKGAKETLVLTDESALVVSVKNNPVVTVMDKASLKHNVFTKIDSTVVV